MEMLIDIYEQTTNATYLTQFTNLYNGFVWDYGTSWTWNEYNDDIMWMVIACARAYQHTGNSAFRNVAKSNFDACYARAWSSDLGGGLWWKWPTNTSKNACVNGPAAIAAYLLYQIYADTNYLAKANDIFLWERATLTDTNTGRVYDSIYYTGTKDQTPITYNQGTYIGAANYLGYTNEAMVGANYTRNSMGAGGRLPNYDEDNDLGGFNGIFIRWMSKFMKERNLQSTYQIWLQQNANAAWNVRRKTDHLSWSKWRQQTPAGTRYSFGCWGSVLAMQVVPPTQTPSAGVVFMTVPDASGTSSFESGLHWSDATAPSSLYNYVVSNALVLRTPQDGLNHSFAGSSLTLSNGALLAFKNTSGSRVISVGTDLFIDNGAVADWAGVDAELAGKITLRAGGVTFDPQTFPTLTVSAQINGPGAVSIDAASGSTQVGGKVLLVGYNTYTGGTMIDATDTLRLSSDGTLGSTNSSLTFSNSEGYGFGTLDLNGTTQSIGNLTGTGGKIINNASGTAVMFTIGNGNVTGGNFQGLIGDNTSGTGTVAMVKVGTGTLQLSGTNTYTGGTTIASGTLQLGDGVRNGSVLSNITNNAALVFANPVALTCTNNISGTGSFTKLAAGKLTLSGLMTHSGSTTVGAGTLALLEPVALNNSPTITISNGASLDVIGRADQTLFEQRPGFERQRKCDRQAARHARRDGGTRKHSWHFDRAE
jgi:autotransporter-associated beta strand protein